MKLESFGRVLYHAPIKNTYKINATTKYLLYPKTTSDVLNFLKYAKKEKIPYWILGGGSNIIVSDTEYDGVIVSLQDLNQIIYEKNCVTAYSDVKIPTLAIDIINHGLKGLEWATGIPATIGGCIYGNAEAYKISTFEYLESVTYINEKLEIVTKDKKELTYGYRTSYFKEHPKCVILSGAFQFPTGNMKESMEIIQERTKRRQETQPLEYPSAGSVFRNPSPENPTWKIIDSLGLKGTKIGGAMISEKHANFIINIQNATGKDVRNLIELIKNRVKEETNIDLILEQEYKDW